MGEFSDELRLLWAIVLNGALFLVAFRFAIRSAGQGKLAALCDAFLIYFVVQYVAVAVPGVLGELSLATMSGAAIVPTIMMAIVAYGLPPYPVGADSTILDEAQEFEIAGMGRMRPTPSPEVRERLKARKGRQFQGRSLLACGLFVVGYLAAHAYVQRFQPPLATDSLVYHLPMAVQWMQTGHLGIYPTWYWNPAASYSPATGSTFMAWWMILAGNEVFVRFVQLPALLFLFCLVARICRLLGTSAAVAGLIAIAATLSRPLFSEAVFTKDDLYVTAFVICALLAFCTIGHGGFSTRRVGLSLGMVLASKYTVLLACPLFLFVIDRPWRGPWRFRSLQWPLAIILTTVLSLPWYLRNLVLFHNPLYPVDIHLGWLHLRGMFVTERDQQLRSAAGVWTMLSQTYHSLPMAMLVLLAAGWVAALWLARARVWRSPLCRVCVIGPAATLALFLIVSPHHEVRYVFPQIVLLFTAVGAALSLGPVERRIPVEERKREIGDSQVITFTTAGSLAAISVATSLDAALWQWIVTFTVSGLALAVLGVGATRAIRRFRLKRQSLSLIGVIAGIALLLLIYVQWHAYIGQCRQLRMLAWGHAYPRLAGLWTYVDEQLPADSRLAYANTFFVYPLYGYEYTRHVAYAPVRLGLHKFERLGPIGDRVPGDLIVRQMTGAMNTNPDAATWRNNLRDLGAQFLFVAKGDPQTPDLAADPPELGFARGDPAHFQIVYEDEGGVVFRIVLR